MFIFLSIDKIIDPSTSNSKITTFTDLPIDIQHSILEYASPWKEIHKEVINDLTTIINLYLGGYMNEFTVVWRKYCAINNILFDENHRPSFYPYYKGILEIKKKIRIRSNRYKGIK